MLAAVALPELGDFDVGGINGGQFIVMLFGGIIGLIIMRFGARQFVGILEKYPSLEMAAFLIVGWVGVKLLVMTLTHPELKNFDPGFPHSALWNTIFWVVPVGLGVQGYFRGVRRDRKRNKHKTLCS